VSLNCCSKLDLAFLTPGFFVRVPILGIEARWCTRNPAKHATFFPSLISLCCLVLHVLLWCCWRLVAKFQLEGRVVQRSGNRNWLVVSSETIRMYPTSTWLKRTTKQQGIASHDSYSDFSDGKMDSWREHQPALSCFVNKERMRGVNFKRTTWEPIRLWRITQEFLKNWSERIYIYMQKDLQRARCIAVIQDAHRHAGNFRESKYF
jgi:hypothetical protein